MGRRATSTTKGGKYMNPTDQARKEARRRELKKNKKQRMAVRQAVIKTKDPKQMLAELDLLDEMELDPASNVPYNDKVVREKRLKLLENVQRITQYYLREDPEQGTELKRLVDNYRKDRLKKEVYFESVRNAQKVKIDSIPLPEAPFQTPQLSDIPLPGAQPQGILKKGPSYIISAPTTVVKKEPPGPPPGPPPLKKKFKGNDPLLRPRPPPGPPPMQASTSSHDKDAYDPEEGPLLDDARSDEEDKSDDEFQHRDEDDEVSDKRKKSRDQDSDDESDVKRSRLEEAGITPLQAMMLKIAGQGIPKPGELPSSSGKKVGFSDSQQKPPPGPPPGLPPGPPGLPRMVPPGPPPGQPPTIPRGPPPGLPPAMQIRMGVPPARQGADLYARNAQADINQAANMNILSAPPSIHRQDKDKSRPGMIVAKPQIISNPRADVTRFMPTSLRVKRESITKIGPYRPQDVEMPTTSTTQRQERTKKQSKQNADIAYDSFMKEMKGLL